MILIDFGLSCRVQGPLPMEILNEDKKIVEQYVYFSPEFVKGENKTKSDIYSFGIICLQCWSLITPEKETKSPNHISKIILSMKDKTYHNILVDLIEQCIVEDYEKRSDFETLLKHKFFQ